ncbi:MAG: ABC transporter permease [Aeriscardovia sp.]|nr:ABC transporter permease [Aeriscardovia sp.]
MKYYFAMSIKRLLRAPTSLIFNLIYPVFIVILSGAIAGNHMMGGRAESNYFISEALGKSLIPMACISFAMYVARQIGNGSLTRLNYFGVKTRWLMLADLLAQIVCAAMGVAIAMIVAWLAFRLKSPGAGYFFAYILQLFFALVTLMVWGQVAGVVIRNVAGIILVGIIESFFLLFCAGGAATLDAVPRGVKVMAECFPISWVSYKMPAVWIGQAYWVPKFLWISAIWLVAGILILWFMSLAGNPFIRAMQKQKIQSSMGKSKAKSREAAKG